MRLLPVLITALISSVLTLFVYSAIMNFAPLGFVTAFSNPMATALGLQYEQEREYEKEQKMAEKRFKEALKKNVVLYGENDPYLGSKDAKITVVEFMDYKCGYCGAAHSAIKNILADQKYKGKVKVVLKQFPILGEASIYAATGAFLAFQKSPETFEKVHDQMFASKVNTQADVEAILKKNGVTASADFRNNSTIQGYIEANMKMARDFGIKGTPAFIIGEEFIGGYVPEEEMRKKLDALLK